MGDVRIESATTKDELLRLREPWEALSASGAATTPFQAWAVTFHAWRMEASVVAPFVLVARAETGTVHGVLPLGLRVSRRGPFVWRDLATIGPTRLDFVDLVATPDHCEDVLQACIDWLASRWSIWDALQLNPVREDARLLSRLGAVRLPAFIESVVDAAGHNHAVTIPAGARGWEDVCDGENRRSTRRILKRLDADGFRVVRVSQGHDVHQAVENLVCLHTRRRGEHGEASRLAAVEREHLCALVTDAVTRGGDLMIMEHADVPVAAQLTLRLSDRVSHYRVAFHSDYRKWSPGIGLLVAAIDDAVKTGAREYDFGFGTEEYKLRWADVHRRVYTVRLANRHFGRTPRRAWMAGSTRLRSLRRRFAKKLTRERS
jgi:CelD/BcsL family acetyltransferase involved in cellulose biosynthesis